MSLISDYFEAGFSPANESHPGRIAERSTVPDASMKMFLRFQTPSGPRTILVSNVPLRTASEIADAMLEAGHEAQFFDQGLDVPVAELVRLKHSEKTRRQKREQGAVRRHSNVIALDHQEIQPALAVAK